MSGNREMIRPQIWEELAKELGEEGFWGLLRDIQEEFTEEMYSLDILHEKFKGFLKKDMDSREKLSMLVKAAIELTSQESPRWENIAGWILDFQFTDQLKKEEKKS